MEQLLDILAESLTLGKGGLQALKSLLLWLALMGFSPWFYLPIMWTHEALCPHKRLRPGEKRESDRGGTMLVFTLYGLGSGVLGIGANVITSQLLDTAYLGLFETHWPILSLVAFVSLLPLVAFLFDILDSGWTLFFGMVFLTSVVPMVYSALDHSLSTSEFLHPYRSGCVYGFLAIWPTYLLIMFLRGKRRISLARLRRGYDEDATDYLAHIRCAAAVPLIATNIQRDRDLLIEMEEAFGRVPTQEMRDFLKERAGSVVQGLVNAVFALAEIGDPKAVHILAYCLVMKHKGVKEASLKALECMSDPAVGAALEKCCKELGRVLQDYGTDGEDNEENAQELLAQATLALGRRKETSTTASV